ncbi:MAG: hypothetical protein PWP65_34 [Clostridia bacterium]|nr:hypothetical protein [Clostridia bacterium]
MSGVLRQSYSKRRQRLSFVVFLVFLVGCYLLYSFLNLSLAARRMGRELQYYEAKKAALLQERERLRAEIKRLQDDVYIEKVAREELGWVRPDEVVVLRAQPGEVLPLVPPKREDLRD